MPRYGLFYYYYGMDVQTEQLNILERYLLEGTRTVYARQAGIIASLDYDAFNANVPLSNYKDLEPWVAQCKAGVSDVLWPGKVNRFAVSAGTTGIGKHIPIYDDRIGSDLRFMRRVMRHVIRDNPDPGLFLGKHLALSGSVQSDNGVGMGEISGILACASPKWIRYWHTICPEKAAYTSWNSRLESLIRSSLHSDIRVLTGVPSWILILLREISTRRGLPIEQVWPNLRLIITGGVALTGYIDAFRSILGGLSVRYLENYGASEGYFSFDWFDSGSMLLQHDADVFYEFYPIESKVDTNNDRSIIASSIIPLWEVKPHIPYGLVVTNMGLWRYITNDVLTFTTVNPPRIQVSGRLNEMIDTFGEAVTSADVHHVIGSILPMKPFQHLHIRPTWSENPPLPTHEWIMVISDPVVNRDISAKSMALADQFDRGLQGINRHYAIRRQTGALTRPLLRVIGINEYESLIRALPKSQSKLGMFI